MPDSKLDEIIAEYLREEDTGSEPDPFAWIERHKKFAPELREFFDAYGQTHATATPLREIIHAENGKPDAISIDQLRATLDEFGDHALNDYEIIGEIGRGGMGLVLKARQRSLQRNVALKIVTADPLLSPARHRRFQVEVESVAMLDHPNIVPIYECGSVGPYRFFTMKLISGHALSQQMDDYATRPRDAARLIARVARALHYAHQRGVIHRDIKPANILLDHSDVPYVTDFGLAQQTDQDVEITMPGIAVGTIGYMAPEQISGEGQLTTAVDVYSLGVVLYELLAGSSPFSAKGRSQTLLEIQRRVPVAPDRIRPEVDRDLTTICMKCLEKDPNARYHSADALAEDLTNWLNNEPIAARRSTLAYRARKWMAREPHSAVLFGIALLSIVLGIGGVIWKWYDAEQNRLAAETARNEAVGAERAALAAQKDAEKAAMRAKAARKEAVAARKEKADARRELLRQVYVNHLMLADHALAIGDFATMERELKECTRRHRDWSHDYLMRRLSGFAPRRLAQHALAVTTCAVSSDGDFVATGSRAGTVILQRLGDPSFVKRFTLETRVVSVEFSPDGQALAVGTTDGTVHQLALESLEQQWMLSAHDTAIACVRYSPDGSYLATCAGSQNTAYHGEIALWDAKTGEIAHRISQLPRRITSLVYSPDSVTLVSAGEDGFVCFWNVSDAKMIREMHVSETRLRSIDIDWSGQRLATLSRSSLKLFDLRDGREIAKWVQAGRDLAFSPDGARLFVGGIGDTGKVAVLDAQGLEPLLWLHGQNSTVRDVDVAPDGLRLVAAGDDKQAIVWDASPARDGQTPSWEIERVRFSAKKNDMRKLERTKPVAMAVSNRGRRIATANEDGNLFVWDAEACKLVHRLETASSVVALCFDRDESRLAFADRNHAISVWDLNARVDSIQTLLPDKLTKNTFNRGLAFHPSKQLLAARGGMFVTVWDLREQGPVWREKTEFYEHVGAVYSPDGEFIASGGVDHSVRICRSDTGECIHELKGHQSTVSKLVISPDGTRLASCGLDGRIVVWSLESPHMLASLTGHVRTIDDIAFSPDGTKIASSSEDLSIRVWDIAEAECVLCVPVTDQPAMKLLFSENERLTAISATRGVPGLRTMSVGATAESIDGLK